MFFSVNTGWSATSGSPEMLHLGMRMVDLSGCTACTGNKLTQKTNPNFPAGSACRSAHSQLSLCQEKAKLGTV